VEPSLVAAEHSREALECVAAHLTLAAEYKSGNGM
jgi:hypothetical protein